MFSLYNQLKAKKARSSGFTIVELLIVIVVIGILATLVIVTFSGIQQKGRNSQRQTDINALQSHVEAYYASAGSYPTASMINDDAWRAKNMKGLDVEALKDPKGTTKLAGAATATAYGYAPLVGASTACTETGTGDTRTADCDNYSLTAKQENGDDYTKKSN